MTKPNLSKQGEKRTYFGVKLCSRDLSAAFQLVRANVPCVKIPETDSECLCPVLQIFASWIMPEGRGFTDRHSVNNLNFIVAHRCCSCC